MTMEVRLRLIRSFSLFFVLMLILISTTSADEYHDQVRNHSIEDGSWAVQFSIPGWFRFEDFDGKLSLKKHFSDKSAWRVGLGYRQFTEDNPNQRVSRHKLDVSISYIRYPMIEKNVKLFWGIGAEALFFRDEDNYFREYYAPYTNRRYGLGLIGSLGVEWFATKEIAFFLEYQASVRADKVQEYHSWTGKLYDKGYDYIVELSEVYFGLNAYF